jgi:hypothetical protein
MKYLVRAVDEGENENLHQRVNLRLGQLVETALAQL